MNIIQKPKDFREAVILLDEGLSLEEKQEIMYYDDQKVGSLLFYFRPLDPENLINDTPG